MRLARRTAAEQAGERVSVRISFPRRIYEVMKLATQPDCGVTVAWMCELGGMLVAEARLQDREAREREAQGRRRRRGCCS